MGRHELGGALTAFGGRVASAAAAGLAAAVLLGGCGSDDEPERAATEGARGDATREGADRRRGSRSQPNLIVVMTDDQTLGELEVMSRTKRLLGERGATFEDAIVSFPLCCPSRATYLTGRYAHNHGVLSNSPDHDGGYERLDGNRTVAVWLQRAGYRTAQIGRYLNFYGVLDPTEVPPGWDEWAVTPGPSTYLMYDYDLNRNGEIEHYGERPRDYQTDVYARIATEFIRAEAAREEPFFLSLTPLAPHDENDEAVPSRFDGPRPAPRHRGRLVDLDPSFGPAFDEADASDKPPSIRTLPRLSMKQRRDAVGSYKRRARSLLAVDELMAKLVRTLRKTDQLDDTYVIFTSDNGFMFGEHRLKGKIAPYEGSLRVPLLARGPGIEPGTTIGGMAANVDLAPTLLDAAGSRRRQLDGISLLPAMLGRRNLPDREILIENLDRSRVPKHRLYRGIRSTRWSYFQTPRGETELYDLQADPHQLENLAGTERARTDQRRLERSLRRLRDCAGDDCR
jgi:N-acetylglucosamine-6-sulfatase